MSGTQRTDSLAFFDTNVEVYSDDVTAPHKRELARALLREYLRDNRAVFSVQVMQEYYSAALRKLRIAPDIAQKLETLALGRVVTWTRETYSTRWICIVPPTFPSGTR